MDDVDRTSGLLECQEKLIAILPLISALLSIVGSGVIIRMTLRRRLQTSFERILFGLSAADVSSSVVNALGAYLVPKDTSHRIWTVGNETTCNALGTLWQITTAGFMYSGMLSFYFLCTIRFGMTEDTFRTKVEPLVHMTAFGGPLISGLIGLGLDVYGEVRLGPGCWTVPDKQYGEMFGWIAAFVPMSITIVQVVTSQIIIFRYCRDVLQRSSQWATTATQGASTLQSNNHNKEARMRNVAVQSFSYVGAFLLVNAWPTILRILDNEGVGDESDVFVLLVLQAIFLPSQGFFNCLIYLRPRYSYRRSRFASETRWESLVHVIQEANVVSSSSRDGRGSNNRRWGRAESLETAYWDNGSTLFFAAVRSRASRVFGRTASFDDSQPPVHKINNDEIRNVPDGRAVCHDEGKLKETEEKHLDIEAPTNSHSSLEDVS